MSKELPQVKFFPPVRTPMLPIGCLAGKVALVTGGGTGLGKGIATMLSALGALVTIGGRRKDVIVGTAKEISKCTRNKVLGLELDVRHVGAVQSAIAEIEKKFGSSPDVVVNNAAGNFVSPAERLSTNAIKTVYDIVLNGTTNVTMETAKKLINSGRGGTYLSITTTYCEMGSGYVAASAASKAGVQNLARSLAYEWGKKGIRLNCLSPGPIETEGATTRLDPTGGFLGNAVTKIPIGRLGKVEELANLASYMVSPYSSWMTGSTIIFDGGELGFCAGEFNFFDQVSDEQWTELEAQIRGTNAQSKKKK